MLDNCVQTLDRVKADKGVTGVDEWFHGLIEEVVLIPLHLLLINFWIPILPWDEAIAAAGLLDTH
jgi:hypothetical protein